jgi:hypothetical protein
MVDVSKTSKEKMERMLQSHMPEMEAISLVDRENLDILDSYKMIVKDFNSKRSLVKKRATCLTKHMTGPRAASILGLVKVITMGIIVRAV